MDDKADKELVVLLHGILDSASKMKAMERRMQDEGFDTLNITYPSTSMDLAELTEYLHGQLRVSESFNKAAKVHFVSHSMGGLLARYYIHKYRPDNLARVVMAGTPNSGSEFADFLSGNPVLRPLFEKVCGPMGAQLRVTHEHAPDMKIDYEVGVIAGRASINPLAPFVLPDGAHDGVVTVESTKLDGMTDHIILKANHPFMMSFAAVQDEAVHFIRRGRFRHGPQ